MTYVPPPRYGHIAAIGTPPKGKPSIPAKPSLVVR